MISNKALKEFKAIYKKKFDIELSDQDALESATKLLKLVEIVYKPMTKKNMKGPKNEEKKQDNREVEDNKDWEARQNLFGFFSLLLEVDKRVNPHLYKKIK